MSTVQRRGLGWLRGSPLFLAGVTCLAVIVAWWTWRALHDSRALDTGLAWDAGKLGWATGHPERLSSWNGMTFLAACMAVVTNVLGRRHAAELVTLLNLAVALGLLVAVLRPLRRLLSPGWWWVAAFALVSFGPLMSTVWWKQFNLIALAMAAAGYELARRRRHGSAALTIALSVSVKPLFFLLPFYLLARRRTRRVGATALAWVVAIDVAAQGLFALRAGTLSALDPTIGPRNLLHKTSAAGNPFLCLPVNFSPGSLLCQINGGFANWTLQRVLATLLVATLGVWAAQVLRGRPALSWDWFAFAGPLSVMLSALSWNHYQIVLMPLFLLLFVKLTRDGHPGEWLGLLLAFLMSSVIWSPYGNIIDAAQGVPASLKSTDFLQTYAQLAQYVVIMTAILWYARHPHQPQPADGAAGEDRVPSTSAAG